MCDSNVPSKSSGSTPCSRCASSLHCMAPEPTSHSQLPDPGQGLALAEPSFDLGECRLRQPLLGDVADDDDCDQRRVALGLHGAGGQRDRHRHAVLAHGAGLESTNVLAGQHRGDDRCESLAVMVGDQRARRGGRRSRRARSRTAARRVRLQDVTVPSSPITITASSDSSITALSTPAGSTVVVFSIAGVEHQPSRPRLDHSAAHLRQDLASLGGRRWGSVSGTRVAPVRPSRQGRRANRTTRRCLRRYGRWRGSPSPSGLTARTLREQGVDVEVEMRKQIDLVDDHHVDGAEHDRILERLLLALGDGTYHRPAVLADVELRRTDEVADVLDHEQVEVVRDRDGTGRSGPSRRRGDTHRRSRCSC